MFDNLGFKSIFSMVYIVTLALAIMQYFVTIKTNEYYDNMGFFGSLKYKIIIALILCVFAIFFKYKIKNYKSKKYNKNESATSQLFGGVSNFFDTVTN